MIRKIFGVFAAIVLLAGQMVYAVSVTPNKLELYANNTRKNYITTTLNVGGNPTLTRLKVYTGYFDINENGEFNFIDEGTDSPYDLSKKIRFIPSEFNVAPNKLQKLRVNIPNVNKLPVGESRVVLYVENVDGKEYDIPTGRKGVGAQLIVKTRFAVPIYVYNGKIVRNAEIESFKITEEGKDKYTEMKIKAIGNAKVSYKGKIQALSGKELLGEYDITPHAIGHGSYIIVKDKIQTNKIPASGAYKLRVIISYQDEKNRKKNLTKELDYVASPENITEPVTETKQEEVL